ncbi:MULTISPECIES: hypothetical protein [unclassified Streptomyces]|uniref:hypothetical protein n=1 Tax=unclassified Streptomyces TaxID=2593676 RepID=UPI0004BD2072|nr:MULTISPECIES: hypothetical protein [unclassified Streptomyces]
MHTRAAGAGSQLTPQALIRGPAPTLAPWPGRGPLPCPEFAERVNTLAAHCPLRRNKLYRRPYEEETVDDNADGIPDIHHRANAAER